MQSKTPKVKSPTQALATLEWICSKMERCTSDVRRSLYRWGITSTEEQEEIIEKLRSAKFIDDSRYADAYVRDKLITGRWGEAKIRAGLRAKGIAPSTIEDALSNTINPEELNHKLRISIERHYQSEKSKHPDRYKLRAKLFRRAASRGFNMEQINNIIDKVLDE